MGNIEVWRDIPIYLGMYQVSNFGRVRTYPKKVRVYNANGDDIEMTIGGDIVCHSKDKKGYCHVTLCSKNENRSIGVHRLVAMSFIPNPEGCLVVNHKDENPSNNHVGNLEWCTNEYNLNYGTARERQKRSKRKFHEKTIEMLTLDNIPIRTFRNFSEIEDYFQINGLHANIIAVCKGRRNKCLGYKWRIVDEK